MDRLTIGKTLEGFGFYGTPIYDRPQVERTKWTTGEKYMSKAEIKATSVKKIAGAKTCICTCIQTV